MGAKYGGSNTTLVLKESGSAKNSSVRRSEVELRWEMEVAAVCQQFGIGKVAATKLELAPVVMNANVLVSSNFKCPVACPVYATMSYE